MTSRDYRGYTDFAFVYDLLTKNVPYDEIAEYYSKLLKRMTDGRRILDIGCGTGNLTIRLSEMGFDIVGLDASEDMISIADEKGSGVSWVCRNMTEINLGEQFDAVISTLDSINHLKTRTEMERCFGSVAESLRSGGIFLFDANTVYKHREILANNTFVYDAFDVYCVWQNEYSPRNNTVTMNLDIFEAELPDETAEYVGGSYFTRSFDSHREIALPIEDMRTLLKKNGFEVVEIYDYLTLEKPRADSEKLMFVTKKDN